MPNQAKSDGVPYDEHDESGQFERRYTSEQVVGALEDLGGSASTSEVSDTLGCSRRLALLRLRELEDDNRVSARSVGNTYLWTYIGDERADVNGEEARA
jgi:hypothetical protein